MTAPLVIDAEERRIEVGSLVNSCYGLPPGRVIRISDPDGDVDEAGRPFGISPRVYVLWPESEDYGDLEEFHTSHSARGPRDDPEPHRCDDIVVVDD